MYRRGNYPTILKLDVQVAIIDVNGFTFETRHSISPETQTDGILQSKGILAAFIRYQNRSLPLSTWCVRKRSTPVPVSLLRSTVILVGKLINTPLPALITFAPSRLCQSIPSRWKPMKKASVKALLPSTPVSSPTMTERRLVSGAQFTPETQETGSLPAGFIPICEAR